MHQNVLHLSGTVEVLILAGYVVGGLVAAAAGCLPGNPARFRLFCVAVGLGMSVWAAKVLLLGGPIFINPALLVAPVALTVAAVSGTLRTYRSQRGGTVLAPPRPHPAARTYTEPVWTPQSMPAPGFALVPPAPARPYSSPAAQSPTFGQSLPAQRPMSAPAAACDQPSVPVQSGFGQPPAFERSAPFVPAPAFASLPVGAPARSSASGTPAHAAPVAPAAHALSGVIRRFHGHAIAPPAAFPTPPRFAPQPLHNVPSPRPAPDGYVTVHAEYPADAARPAPAHPGMVSPPARPVAPPVRMALAPVTELSPLQPSAVRARHRAATTA